MTDANKQGRILVSDIPLIEGKKKSIKLILISLVSGLFLFVNASGQEKKADKFIFGALLSGDLSNHGLYGGVGASVTQGNFSLALSPVINFNETAFPFNGPLGLNASLYYFPGFTDEKRVNMCFNLDYKLILNNKNTLNEFVYGYGVMVRLLKGVYLCNNLNVGLFTEKLYSYRKDEYLHHFGFNSLVKTAIHIRFGKK